MDEDRGRSKSRSRSRSPRKEGETVGEKSVKLFVTNIDSRQNEEVLKEDLHREFSKYGDVKEIVIKTKQHSDNSFVFVEFTSVEEAEKGLEGMRGKVFRDKVLKVEFGNQRRGDAAKRSSKNCYNCGKSTHIARDCPDRRSSDRRNRSRSRSYRRSRKSRSRSGGRRYRDHDDRKKRYSRSRSDSRKKDGRRRSRSRSSRRDRNY